MIGHENAKNLQESSNASEENIGMKRPFETGVLNAKTGSPILEIVESSQNLMASVAQFCLNKN